MTELDVKRLRELHADAWRIIAESGLCVDAPDDDDRDNENLDYGTCDSPICSHCALARLAQAIHDAKVLDAADERDALRADVERLRKAFRARIGDPDAKCTRCYGSGYVNEDGVDYRCECKSEADHG